MTDSKRLTILKTLSSMLQEITEENGYENTVASVVRGQVNISAAEVSLPFISLLEPVDQNQIGEYKFGGDYIELNNKWTLFIKGWAKDDLLNPTDPAHSLLADVKKRLSTIMLEGHEDYCLLKSQKLITKIEVGSGVVSPTESKNDKAFFLLRVDISLSEDLVDPYRLT